MTVSFFGVARRNTAIFDHITGEGHTEISGIDIVIKYDLKIYGERVVCRSSTSVDIDIYTHKNLVQKICYNFFDVISYANGCDIDFIIESAVSNAGMHIFGDGIGVLQKRRVAHQEISDFNKIIKIQNETNNKLPIALRSFNLSKLDPLMTGFYCYQMIECLVRDICSISDNIEKRDWEKFRSQMKVQRDCINFIKEFADPIRHGGEKSITDSDRALIFFISDEILRRYILLKGKQIFSEYNIDFEDINLNFIKSELLILLQKNTPSN